jgi:hypothetical protein
MPNLGEVNEFDFTSTFERSHRISKMSRVKNRAMYSDRNRPRPSVKGGSGSVECAVRSVVVVVAAELIEKVLEFSDCGGGLQLFRRFVGAGP